MADLATAVHVIPGSRSLPSSQFERRFAARPSGVGVCVFVLALLAGVGYIGVHIAKDLDNVTMTSAWPYLLLGLALFIALGFEFVNGFHDTANAVATVIYTNSLPPHIAVVWSGICNLTGVLLSSGTVAFAVITLLPVELILKVSSGTGFAMVFALLIAAILWNLGTWWFGLPASSSHTMVGSIIGVGLASQLMNAHGRTSGLDWSQVTKVLEALLISPLLGFALAGVLLLLSKHLFRYQALYEAPKGNEPPPWPIRALMVGTCTGVSYFHGSNDGQKGMGLIMLILIGTVPTAYALNHNVSPAEVQSFIAASVQAGQILERHVPSGTPDPDPRTEITDYIHTKQLQPTTLLALSQLVSELNREVSAHNSLRAIPAEQQTSIRNDMYLTGRALKIMDPSHNPAFTAQESAALKTYQGNLDKATRFIPIWVKVAVALALGLGTMVGWKRIVITVGEKIGKEKMTYAQGASAGLVTMVTIFAADTWSLPVSTTHILSSGVAGTMAANGSGLRWSTVRAIAAGWVFTLPAAAVLSGLLYLLFRTIF
ncbi:MAG: inorganic phosphate transporter [Terracidiphilus sp.]|nr:inorganic phosphate transporter [Terracidiphilus sp.]